MSISVSFQLVTMDRDDDDFGEGFIAESHPLQPTQLMVPGGRDDSRAPSISSSVSDLDAPIYARETAVPLSSSKVNSRTIIFYLRIKKKKKNSIGNCQPNLHRFVSCFCTCLLIPENMKKT